MKKLLSKCGNGLSVSAPTQSLKTFACIALLPAFILSLTGCATVLSGTSQKVSINSNPPGADVMLNGEKKGVTPVVLDMKKETKVPQVTLKKEGYEDKLYTLPVKFDGIGLLNIFVPIGFVVDFVTGAFSKYDPTSHEVALDKKK